MVVDSDQDTLSQDLRALVEAKPAFAELEATLGRGESVALSGVPGSARGLALAALGSRRPLLIVVPDQEAVLRLSEGLEELVEERPLLRNPSLSLFDEAGEELGGGTLGARLRVVRALGETPTPIVVTSATSLLQRLPAPERAGAGVLQIAPGGELDPHDLARRLVERQYRRVPLVEAPGEFAIRGGIVDLYALGAAAPIRIELFGDEVESIRSFEPGTQRSIAPVASFALPLLAATEYRTYAHDDAASLMDHLPPEMAVAIVNGEQIAARLAASAERFVGHEDDLLEASAVEAGLAGRTRVVIGMTSGGTALTPIDLGFVSAGLTSGGRLEEATNELARQVRRGERLTVACVNEAERERLRELILDTGLEGESTTRLRRASDAPGISLVVSGLSAGLRDAEQGVWLLASSRLFARHVRSETRTRRSTAAASAPSTAVESFADLEIGKPVVHVTHGIARFEGIVRRERDGKPRDLLHLLFAEGAVLYIPTDRIGLVRRYVGPTNRSPRLSRLGGKTWKTKTKKAAEAVRDLAADLLEVQAERLMRPGFAFPPDDRWQRLFEESFPYTDTPDQGQTTIEVKRDMETPRAMDRVVCGDVGYGKTEIACRAAFKAAAGGRQTAVLAPTTVLAHQHYRTFTERTAAYPIRVEVVSRFLTASQVREILKATAKGEVDVLIGTHRILSKDVAFKDLGLVVIDEEQRFGVAHKERLKEFRRTVDVLTLTATPIPRTLHLALSGARDISVLQTPPPGRSPVETKVVRHSAGLIKRAIERELARDGQVFFVHDRVGTIERVAREVRDLVPSATVGIVHGQMPAHEIEERMLAFFEGNTDVLVATTLIENGLDVRRANTLLIDRADRFGLAELHQIRGRVGRSSIRAYAYLMIDEHRPLSSIAQRRLRAIEEFTDLGAGFQIAMRDLEIRGAGNVLGAQQSGHIVSVGYDLYCRLLKRAMAELKGELTSKNLDLERDLDLEAGEIEVALTPSAYVPDAYVADPALKIDCYRKLASAVDEATLDALAEELRDRYGPIPKVLLNLFRLRRVRIRAAGHGVLSIARQDRVLQLRCRSRARLEAGVKKHRKMLRPIDAHMLYVRMKDDQAPDEDQLDYLLDLLKPIELRDRAEAGPSAADEALREERQRRLRAREARADLTRKRPKSGRRRARRGSKKP